jgi:asparagine synthase (glutamine-hydrolysing)
MCGILGVIDTNAHINESIFRNLLKKTSHRGPDESKIWFSNDKKIKLGHNRLSIIDLSSNAHQPMHDSTNNLVIVFNGEIYNFLDLKKELEIEYNFKSESDTEVILKAYNKWGYECVNHLNGMFAFAIYDISKSILFCARDRVGQKPFYYHYKNDVFAFCSELKNLISNYVDSAIKTSSLNEYFKYGFIAGENTIYSDFRKLPPAHYLVYSIKKNEIETFRYWKPNTNLKKTNNDINYNIEKFSNIFNNVVKRHLISDVPLGILLSGGVDSSLVTAFAIKHKPDIKTFTVTFPQFQKYNEAKYAKIVSNHFSTNHIEIESEKVNPEIILPMLAKQFDEPLIDSSMIPTFLVCQEVSKHCKVVLGGDGGDELFGGYNHYQKLILSDLIKKVSPQFFWKFISKFYKFLPTGFKGRVWVESLKYDLKKDLPIIASYFNDFDRKKLFNKEFFDCNDNQKFNKIYKSDDLAKRSMWTDFLNYLPEDILVKTDRASMLNSLELRAPFLDNEIIEFSEKLDNNLKFDKLNKKILLKALSKKILPKKLDISRKQGFAIPLDEWMRNDKKWQEYSNHIFFEHNYSLFNKEYIKRLVKSHREGTNLGERLFSILMFLIWCKEYKYEIFSNNQ